MLVHPLNVYSLWYSLSSSSNNDISITYTVSFTSSYFVTFTSLFNDAARQYYVKKLHGEDVRELKASFNGNVTIEFGKRKHQVYLLWIQMLR